MDMDLLLERYELALERVREVASGANTSDTYKDYFEKCAAFILEMDKLYGNVRDKYFDGLGLDELKSHNRSLYEDILPENYEKSYANPTFAVSVMGELNGRILSFLYTELRGMIVYAYEQRMFDMVIVTELFVQVYCLFEEDEEPKYANVREAVYYYASDYSEDTLGYRILEQLDPQYSFAVNVIENADLTDLRYLYSFGEYVTDNELKTAAFLNSLPEDKIQAMADTYTEGYRIGFVMTGKDLSKKGIAEIRYCLGFERVVRCAIRNFEKLGLKTVIYRSAVNTINKKSVKVGFYGANPNMQYDYDHRYDNALYIDRDFNERRLGVLKTVYENNKEQAALYAGPAVMEVFGEEPFAPVSKSECLKYDEPTTKLVTEYTQEAAQVVNKYIKGEERSFTIIAYPMPSIGENYEEIFEEIVKINTLDYEKYKVIQQNIIDALDKASHVRIRGCGNNKTDICVSLIDLKDPSCQTKFENCLADVNIPLGEVFTSPKLKGTTGVVNVSKVYLKDIGFENLSVTFKDGMITDYTCDNFASEAESKALFKQNIMNNRETLPMGEFAIGTNTTAYVMAKKYGIVSKLPILIVEKMGPHFAVGDTCYSWSEDVVVYNPNGKEIYARDNEITAEYRKDNPDKAYFNCHTDITIPYDEIGEIVAVGDEGEISIIKDGRFVLPGALLLNEPFGID